MDAISKQRRRKAEIGRDCDGPDGGEGKREDRQSLAKQLRQGNDRLRFLCKDLAAVEMFERYRRVRPCVRET